MEFKVSLNVVRVLLVAFNFVFAILSVALIALGVVYTNELWWFKNYAGLQFIELPTLLIILGSLSFVMALLGCCCARTTNKYFVYGFVGILLVLLAIELTVSIIAFKSLNGNLQNSTRITMINQLTGTDSEFKQNFYEIEKQKNCCGINGAMDYLNETFEPRNCCLNQNHTCTLEYINATQQYRMPGCAEVVVRDAERIAVETACFTTVYASLQVMEISCFLLMRSSSNVS